MFSFHQVQHTYPGNTAWNIPDWQVTQGEHWLLLGPSGSGKSTILHLLAALIPATRGTLEVAGQPLAALRGSALDRFRGRSIGIVPQKLHLISSLSVMDNLRLAQHLAGTAHDPARMASVLAALDLTALAHRRPATLSQGQAQRVAIARAVINQPRLLLADEPTAALDDGHAARVQTLLQEQACAVGATLVIATHDQRLRAAFQRHWQLEARP
jgi:ABC-type lipoprotein export system ATPase subunit